MMHTLAISSVLITWTLLINHVNGQPQPVTNSLLRSEQGNNRYDFTNMEKKTGHLFEKENEMEKQLNSLLSREDIDVETYDMEMLKAMDSVSLIQQQFPVFEQTVDDITLICEGEVTLMQLYCPEDTCDGEDQEKCRGCKASFCMMDFEVQKENPEKFPTFMEVIGESRHCDSRLIAKDFNEIVHECKKYDHQKGASALPKIVPLVGLITEIGFTDSELVTNSIIEMDASTRVIVDAQPILEAMTVCDSYTKNRRKKFRGITETSKCNRNKASKLLKDVVYMLSRTRDVSEERMIIKAHPDAVQGIDIFDIAYPDVNWIFIYSDPTAEIGAQMQTSRPERANCVKSKIDPQPNLVDVVQENGLEVESLSLAQYCAASFASLAKKAVVERSLTDKGTFVNADNALEVLPRVFLDEFHTPDPDGAKKSKFISKKSIVESVQQQSHMKKVNLASKEYSDDAELVYGALFKQLEELQGIEPTLR